MTVSKRSVVFVTVDCLRADHVGFLGYNRPTTPFLDSLARESFVLPTAIVGGSPTYYSFPPTFASRPSLSLGRDILGISAGEPTLASAFRDAGYRTAAFTAANPYISSRFGYDGGFETFCDFLDSELEPVNDTNQLGAAAGSRLNRALARASQRLGPAGSIYDELYFQYCVRWATPVPRSLFQLRRFPPADVIVDHAKTWLASIGESPFFLWLHLMDPHAPYYPTTQALSMMNNADVTPSQALYLNSFWNRSDLGPKRLHRHREMLVQLYDAGVRWVDHQLKGLVDSLQQRQLWDSCMFIVTADHGEEFLDHGARFHSPNGLFEETIHVPLLMRVPYIQALEQSRSPFSLLHLAPTVLDAAQVSIPAEFRGHSQWSRLQSGEPGNAPAIAECVTGCTNPYWPGQRSGARILAVRESRYKLVLQFGSGKEDLFDLDADPNELAPLPHGAETHIRRRLLEEARSHLSSERNHRARLRSRMRDLRLEWAKGVA